MLNWVLVSEEEKALIGYNQSGRREVFKQMVNIVAFCSDAGLAGFTAASLIYELGLFIAGVGFFDW